MDIFSQYWLQMVGYSHLWPVSTLRLGSTSFHLGDFHAERYMKTEMAILLGSVIIGGCILVSDGIYEGVPSGSAMVVVRLNKFTGDVAVCMTEDGCVPLQFSKRSK